VSLHHFLILYDVSNQELVSALDLGTNGAAAAATYADKEKELHDRHDLEIVLIGADSLDTIRQTHPHYFDATGADFFSTVVAE
jgi:hypothetical protein